MRFFFDRNMPRQLAHMIAALDTDNEIRSHFDDTRLAPNEPDPSWIATLASDRPTWIVISADYRIVLHKVNKQALREANLTFFALLKGWTNLDPYHQGSKLILLWPQICQQASTVVAPTIFEVHVKPKIVCRGLTRDLPR